MAKTSNIVRDIKGRKYKGRYRNRCKICGRPRGFMRYFGLCRLCFRELVHMNNLPGVSKASW